MTGAPKPVKVRPPFETYELSHHGVTVFLNAAVADQNRGIARCSCGAELTIRWREAARS
jgi:hypothetical protein